VIDFHIPFLDLAGARTHFLGTVRAETLSSAGRVYLGEASTLKVRTLIVEPQNLTIEQGAVIEAQTWGLKPPSGTHSYQRFSFPGSVEIMTPYVPHGLDIWNNLHFNQPLALEELDKLTKVRCGGTLKLTLDATILREDREFVQSRVYLVFTRPVEIQARIKAPCLIVDCLEDASFGEMTESKEPCYGVLESTENELVVIGRKSLKFGASRLIGRERTLVSGCNSVVLEQNFEADFKTTTFNTPVLHIRNATPQFASQSSVDRMIFEIPAGQPFTLSHPYET